MAPENVRFFEGHKYMWDGDVYPSQEDAEAKREEYAGNGFETQIAEGERLAKEYVNKKESNNK